MNVQWTTADVRAFLALYGRAPVRLRVDPLPGWWLNVVLRVEADDERFVLRRYGLTRSDEVLWELALLERLHEGSFPTIKPLTLARSNAGALASFAGGPAILYPFIDGRHGVNVDWSRAVSQTAAAVARLHELTEGLTLPYPRVRSGADPRRSLDELAAVSARKRAAHDGALRDLLDRLEQGVRAVEADVAEHVDLRRGIVHHDAHAKNVLFDSDDRLVALLDFDDAHEGFLIADVAAMVANWAAVESPGGPLDLERAQRIVAEYSSHRPLTAGERAMLPSFVLLHLLGDAATYVWSRLQQGEDTLTAIEACDAYRRYVSWSGDPAWRDRFRGALPSA